MAPDALGAFGAFDTKTARHGSQSLDVPALLPRSGQISMSARVDEVWDKGRAAVFETAVESGYFMAQRCGFDQWTRVLRLIPTTTIHVPNGAS